MLKTRRHTIHTPHRTRNPSVMEHGRDEVPKFTRQRGCVVFFAPPKDTVECCAR